MNTLFTKEKARQVLFLLLLMGLFCRSGMATERYVSPYGDDANTPFTSWSAPARTIQAAINASFGSDIIWVSNGVYNVDSTVNINRPVTLRSVNGPDVTVIDAGGSNRCVYISVANSSLEGFTVTNGNNQANIYGGGIYCKVTSGSSVISNCVISGNSAKSDGYGGGVYIQQNGTVVDSVISGNSAGLGGGGIYCDFGGAIIDSVISNNVASAGNGGGVWFVNSGLSSNCVITANSTATNMVGGGIYFGSGGVDHGSTVSGNSSGRGAGVYMKSGGTMNYSTIAGNNSGYDGGGVYMDVGGAIYDSTIRNNSGNNTFVADGVGGGGGVYMLGYGRVQRTAVENNTVYNYSDGGGIYVITNGLVIRCNIRNNAAPDGYGAGLLLDDGGDVYSCTIEGNNADSWDGGGVYIDGSGLLQDSAVLNNSSGWRGAGVFVDGGEVLSCTIVSNTIPLVIGEGAGIYATNSATVESSILYFNTSDGITDNYLISADSTLTYSCATPLPSGTGNISDNPGFIDFPGEFHIRSDSACINKGAVRVSVINDIDLQPRSTRDIGADEYVTPPGGFSADAGGPYSVDEGRSVVLDGSSSLDGSGSALQYRWNFGDGSDPTDWSYSSTASHTYNYPGSYTGQLLVVNDVALDMDTFVVTVNDLLPTLIVTVDGSVYAREPMNADANGSNVNDRIWNRLEYRSDFGSGWNSWSTDTNITHIFGTQGATSFVTEVRESFIDPPVEIFGSTSSTTTDVTVLQGLAPEFLNTPYAGGEGDSLHFTGSKSGGSSGSLKYRWDPGDGSGWSGWSSSTDYYHTYGDEGSGTYSLRLEVTNEYVSSTSSYSVAVSNLPPSVDSCLVANSSAVWLNDDFSSVASALDPGTNDTVMYRFRYNDGWGGWSNLNSTVFNAATSGIQTVYVQAMDNDGATGDVFSVDFSVIAAMGGNIVPALDSILTSWAVVSNEQYCIERTLDIASPAWTNISGTINATSNSFEFVDTNVFPKAFYRAVHLP